MNLGTKGSAVSSDFRVKPEFITSLPTSVIEVRQDPKQDPNRTASPMLLASVEFDPDQIASCSIALARSDDRTIRTTASYANVVPANQNFAVLKVGFSSDVRATRGYTEARAFRQNTAQATFMADVSRAVKFKIVISLARQGMKAQFDSYIDLVNNVRRLSEDGRPRNDWFYSRMANYNQSDACPFKNIIDAPESEVFTPRWLQSGHPDMKDYAIVLADGQAQPWKPPRNVFTPSKSYYSQQLSALLQDRAEVQRLTRLHYNRRTFYSVQLRRGGSKTHYSVHIKLTGQEDRKMTTSAPIPYLGTKVSVFFKDRSDLAEPSTAFEGRVIGETADNADFSLDAQMPNCLADVNFEPEPDQWYTANVFPEIQNPDNKKKLDVPQSAYLVGFRQHPMSVALPVVDGKQYGYVEMQNIVGEQHLDVWSPDYSLPGNEPDHDADAHQAMLDDVAALQRGANLNIQQTEAVHTAWHGARSNVAIIHGLPGTGKSSTEAIIIAMFLRRGIKTLGTAQSNPAAKVLFNKVTQTLRQSQGFEYLADKRVLVRNAALEMKTTEALLHFLPQQGPIHDSWLPVKVFHFM